MAFYGFLRCNEFTCWSSNFEPLRVLTLCDVIVDSRMYTVVLKRSKCVENGVGIPVMISQINFLPLLFHGRIPTLALLYYNERAPVHHRCRERHVKILVHRPAGIPVPALWSGSKIIHGSLLPNRHCYISIAGSLRCHAESH